MPLWRTERQLAQVHHHHRNYLLTVFCFYFYISILASLFHSFFCLTPLGFELVTINTKSHLVESEMPPPPLTLLRSYATKSDPTTLPSSILFSYTPTFLTIFDCFPKSIFHFLILPRPAPSVNVFSLATLRVLLSNKTRAREVIFGLKDETEILKKKIEGEMMERYGFVWEIWAGFHAVPSMEYAGFSLIYLSIHSVDAT